MYAVVDIETTGGSPVTEKITEIAIYLFDGEKVVKEYSTLINPERKIPYYITNLTGITNAMVSDCIFVAHNVSFDYHFIRNEFKRLGYNYSREKICTVQLSRKMMPGLPSYSLGKLCSQLNIRIKDRHRAGGDALATTKLLEYLLRLGTHYHQPNLFQGLDKKDLHPNFDPDTIQRLPEATGTYYLYNDKTDLIYIGKSKNIRNRVLSHFRNFNSKKSIEMRNDTVFVDYELTGSEKISGIFITISLYLYF